MTGRDPHTPAMATTAPVAPTTQGPGPSPTGRRGLRALVAAAVVAALVVAAVVVVRARRDTGPDGPGLEATGAVQPLGGTSLAPPYGYASAFVVNLHRGRVATYTISMANSTGHDIRIDRVDDLFGSGQDEPAAQVAPLPVPFDFPADGYRPAAGAVLPAGGNFVLRLRIVGEGCHDARQAPSISAQSVTVHYSRLGLDHPLTIPLDDRIVLVSGNGDQRDTGPCGAHLG